MKAFDPARTERLFHDALEQLDGPPRSGGYDGVVINDFAQSKTWGNVRHRSIGFFAASAAQLQTVAVPAQCFDWGPSVAARNVKDTPKHMAWVDALRAKRWVEQESGARSLARQPA